MARRDSFFRRSSLFVVDNTRGTPFKWISASIGVFSIIMGIQCTYFCGTSFWSWIPIFKEAEESYLSLTHEPCDDNLNLKKVEMIGLVFIFNGILRLSFAYCERVADLLYLSMVLTLYDTMILQIGLTMPEIPVYFKGPFCVAVMHQSYITYLAYVAIQKKREFASRSEGSKKGD